MIVAPEALIVAARLRCCGYKAKPGAESRIRIRSRVSRNRRRKPGRRAVIRITAEQNAAHGCAGSRYIGIEVVRHVCGGTAANLSRHIVAVLAAKVELRVTLASGKVAPIFVVVVTAVLELGRVVANVELRQAAVGFALDFTFAAVRPTPNMTEWVFYTSVTRYVESLGNTATVVYGVADYPGVVT